ncbi:hypothetical protein [Sphaerisporangium corydalis]|uniref:Cysteine protease n=1 Tax=Sphaerisporangium corydalis TaxID=1441875 RepID=A0ABV9EG91_9ACTN|nr:hypothetical protein [Sphaerisporangium corydalis]
MAYMVERAASAMARPLGDRRWERALPILDQGDLGSCTGNAAAGALGTAPYWEVAGRFR